MPGAAVIFLNNNIPGPSPIPPPVQEAPSPKKKRTGGSGMPENNLYDLADNDPNHPYYDDETATEAALVDLAQQAQQIANALADAVTVEVNALDTDITIIAASLRTVANTGDALGQLDNATAETSPLSVVVDVFDVIIVGDDE